MPGIRILGRILPLASDDFVFHGLYNCTLQSSSFCLYILLLINTGCETLYPFLITQVLISGIDAAIAYFIFHTSLKGTVSNPLPRFTILYFLCGEYLLWGAHCINLIYGITVLHTACEFSLWTVVVSYGLLAHALVNLIFGIITYMTSMKEGLYVGLSSQQVSRTITPLFLPTAFYNRNESVSPKKIIEEVAAIFTELFGDAELVISDVIVGLLLVRKREMNLIEQKRSEFYDYDQLNVGSKSYHLEESPGAGEGSLASPMVKFGDLRTNQLPILDLSTIAYLSNYAEAMYGAPLYLFSNTKMALNPLCCPTREYHTAVDAIRVSADVGWSKILCCFPSIWFNGQIDHPNIIYKSLKGRLFKSPFAVTVDHRLNAVIISTRGTLSTTDLLVDLFIRETAIEWTLDGTKHTANTHKGIYTIAETIFAELEANGVFRIINQRFPNHKIICCGHSLGAAVSSLLAFILKNKQEELSLNPQIYAICYATPGCIVSQSGISYFESFCTSVVLGDDFITRLNPRNVHILKEKVHYEFHHCQLRKADLLANALFDGIFGQQGTRLIVNTDNQDDFDYGISEPTTNRLYIPGNVLHLQRNGTQVDEQWFKAVWVDPRTFGDRIVISTFMGIDHMPHKLTDALNFLVANPA